ncbi:MULTISPECIES: methyl-accepting chemotaxis protein [unclassified Carboxylicivirga]|uniref:methyl-accepting chemotaxis protein n=1 Tax=Carboxylicivirga TaxID=1628153 RepID=UPI003D34E43A
MFGKHFKGKESPSTDVGKKSIAKGITNNAILLFSISTLAILSVTLYFFRKEIMHSSVMYGDLSLRNGAARIEHHLSKQYVTMQELSQAFNYHLANDQGKNGGAVFFMDYLDKLMKRTDGIDAVFAILEPGTFADKPDRQGILPLSEFYTETGHFTSLLTKQQNKRMDDFSEALYYQQPRSTLKSFVSNPFTYSLNDRPQQLYSIAFPLIIDAEFKGVIGCMINLQTLTEESDKIHIYEGKSSVALLDNKGNYLTHNHQPELIGQNLSVNCLNPEERIENLQKGHVDNWFEGPVGCITNPIRLNEHQLPWQLQAKVHAKYVFKNVIEAAYWIIPIIFLCITMFFVLIRWMIKRDIKPLAQLSLISETIAQGDLTQRMEINSENEIGVLAHSFQTMTDKLSVFIRDVQTGAENINNASQQVSSSSHTLSSSTTEQASVSEEISSNMEEMAASVQQNADKSQEFRQSTKDASNKMNSINEQAKIATQLQHEVVAQVKVVNDIAQNIKILALNAAVEAARAGEHGKGFAVVAREVQKLSETTTIASAQISDKIQLSAASAVQATALIQEISPMLEKLNEGSIEIDAASQEQSQNIQQVTNAAQLVNNTTQSNAASAEELASTSEELNAQAERLAEMVSHFKI